METKDGRRLPAAAASVDHATLGFAYAGTQSDASSSPRTPDAQGRGRVAGEQALSLIQSALQNSSVTPCDLPCAALGR